MNRYLRLTVYGFVLTLLCTSFSHGQVPTTEEEWRASQAQIKKEYSTAKANVWGGAILAGIGVPLTIYGSTHHQECVMGGYALGGGLVCDSYSGRADWKIMGPGLGATGAG